MEKVIPEVEFGVPEMELSIPEIEYIIPELEVGGWKLEVGVPELEVGAWKLEVGVPELDLSVPEMELSLRLEFLNFSIMPKEETTLFRNMSYGDVIQRADLLAISITRDATEFADRGVDEDRLALMTDARDALDAHPADSLMEGLRKSKRILKDAARQTLLVSIRSLRSMAATKYKSVGLYDTFGFKGMDKMSDNDLCRQVKTMMTAATMLKDDLASEGLTTAKITAMTALNTAFDTAIDVHRQAVQNRDVSAQTRVRLGNALWLLMMELANIGKAIFEDTDEAKYNDYVINDSGSGGGDVFTGTVAGSATITITTLEYAAGTELTLTNTGDTPIELSLRSVEGTVSGTPVDLAPGATADVTMGDMNDNPAAVFLCVQNTGVTEGDYRVVVG